MKLNFTFLVMGILTTQLIMAGTPTIDGTFDGEGVWGPPVGTGDGNSGWSNANAKKLYVTFDNDFVYFGGEFSAESWQQFIFVVNTKDGGGSSDAWGRTITYNHANRPDFLFRGDIAKGNYMEFHIWNGTQWTNTGTNQNAGGTNAKGISGEPAGANNGFIEIRVPRSVIGTPPTCDVQFIIGGNNGGAESGHGCFDAVPNDNNGTSWTAPGNATIVSNYANNVILPASLGGFAGELRGNNVQLQWNTLTEQNLSGFGIERSIDARSWDNVGFVAAKNNASGAIYNQSVIKSGASVQFYRLRVTDKDGSFVHSKLVVIKSQPKANAELIGNPVTSVINVAIHTPTPERIQAELIDQSGRRVSNTTYQHPGGSSVMQIGTTTISSGSYILRLNGAETHETIRVVKAK
jgi:hypothetical protein